MADIKIMKAVEFDRLPAKFRKQHADVQALQKAGWWVQPKYDGCFGMAVIRANGEHQMLSREGKDYTPSCRHILNELATLADEIPYSDLDDFVVLGEVWHPDRKFNQISGQFRKNAPSDLQFVANDILRPGLTTHRPYSKRFADLLTLIPNPDGEVYCQFALTYMSHYCQQDVQKYAQELVAQGGYDGAILRDPDAGYTIGLVKAGEIVKVKPTLSLDLQIIGWQYKPGAKTGREVLTIQVRYRDQETWVGSGIPHDMTHEGIAMKIAEIECMGLTEDGKLREPRFKGMRPDKTEPDA